MNMLKIMAYKCTEHFPTCCGDRYREDFVGKLDKDTGEITLVSVGKTDMFEYIQSFAEETDINTLIQRAENGDLSAFSSAVFGDFTDMPETYADALNVVIEAEREFNQLPPDIKKRFQNDFHQYIVTAGTREWFEKFGVSQAAVGADPAQLEKEKEVKSDEQKQ